MERGIAAGFALAVLPVSAWALSTPSDGLVVGPIEIPVGGGQMMPGYRARPKNGTNLPTIIVIHEVFGVHEYVQDVCRRFARLGYVAIAPYLYFRKGDVTKISDLKQLLPIVQSVPQTGVWSDLDALVAWLPKLDQPSGAPYANTGKLGITGFCWGGGTTWTYSAHSSALKAGVAWYGPLAGTATPTQSTFPVDIAATLKTPVLGLYGGKDTHISAADIAKMREALKTGASHSEIVVYPDAEHGFHADYRPSYNAKDAQDGWERALGWFKANGVA